MIMKRINRSAAERSRSVNYDVVFAAFGTSAKRTNAFKHCVHAVAFFSAKAGSTCNNRVSCFAAGQYAKNRKQIRRVGNIDIVFENEFANRKIRLFFFAVQRRRKTNFRPESVCGNEICGIGAVV